MAPSPKYLRLASPDRGKYVCRPVRLGRHGGSKKKTHEKNKRVKTADTCISLYLRGTHARRRERLAITAPPSEPQPPRLAAPPADCHRGVAPACRVTARLYLSVASRSSSRSASAVSCVSTSSFVNRVNFMLELRTTQHCARQTAAGAQRRGSDPAGAATGACATAHAHPFP